MDNAVLITTLLLTLLVIAVSTYFLLIRARSSSGPVIYLVGPSGSGKTALWTYFKYGKVTPTHTSMGLNSASLSHASLDKEITLIDCPGHPRLAHLLRQSLTTNSPRGVVIMIDSAHLQADLNSVANAVYSTLLVLSRPVNVLIVANKSDLFTALPVGKVRELLENEISSLKKTKDDSLDEEEERTILGGPEFKFDELESEGVTVEWTAGSVESRQVAGILEWISKLIS